MDANEKDMLERLVPGMTCDEVITLEGMFKNFNPRVVRYIDDLHMENCPEM